MRFNYIIMHIPRTHPKDMKQKKRYRKAKANASILTVVGLLLRYMYITAEVVTIIGNIHVNVNVYFAL